jgi:hypothetical protein
MLKYLMSVAVTMSCLEEDLASEAATIQALLLVQGRGRARGWMLELQLSVHMKWWVHCDGVEQRLLDYWICGHHHTVACRLPFLSPPFPDDHRNLADRTTMVMSKVSLTNNRHCTLTIPP